MKGVQLWAKGEALNRAVHAFTVGNDPELDLRLLSWDAVASAAHARTLFAAGLLSQRQCQSLLEGLCEAWTLALEGRLPIGREMEDCHTALELFLCDKCGEAGRRIHAGRSRNDQIIAALRLYMRDRAGRIIEQLTEIAEDLTALAEENTDAAMPGYTHGRAAMVSSAGMWFAAFAEDFLDHLKCGQTLIEELNSNPLGAGAGYGTNLPIERTLSARLLGFNRVQRNPIQVQNSRGRHELKLLRWAWDICRSIEKFACDTWLFSTAEYGFVILPVEMTTGSSIMPQKRNPDVVELLRACPAKLEGLLVTAGAASSRLTSGYHRDLQITKEPLIRGCELMQEILPVFRALVGALQINRQKMSSAMSDELYATYYANRLVQQGVAFRDAYVEASGALSAGRISASDLRDDFEAVKRRNREDLIELRSELAGVRGTLMERRERESELLKSIFCL